MGLHGHMLLGERECAEAQDECLTGWEGEREREGEKHFFVTLGLN